MMLLLTVNPAYEAAHHWVDAVLWACLAFFVFEWAVRLRHAYLAQRGWAYVISGRGLVDAVSAAAIPLALVPWRRSQIGVASRRHLDGPRWSRGFPVCGSCAGVLVLESGPLLSVLVIFLMVLLLASVALYFLERDVQPAGFGSVPAALWWGGRHPDHDGLWRCGADHATRPADRCGGDDLRARRIRALDRHFSPPALPPRPAATIS